MNNISVDSNQRCEFYAKVYCKYSCKFSHSQNTLQTNKKSCVITLLPKDILTVIFNSHSLCIKYISSVCKSWNTIINKEFPLRMYIYTHVMNGMYTPGCAM